MLLSIWTGFLSLTISYFYAVPFCLICVYYSGSWLISWSHISLTASLGILHSPLGDSEIHPTLGPSGIQFRLYCWAKESSEEGMHPFFDFFSWVFTIKCHLSQEEYFCRWKLVVEEVVYKEVVQFVWSDCIFCFLTYLTIFFCWQKLGLIGVSSTSNKIFEISSPISFSLAI